MGDCARDEWAPGSKHARTGQTLSLAPAPPAAAAILAPKKDTLCLWCRSLGWASPPRLRGIGPDFMASGGVG